jgi:hypothetical protein
MLATIKFKLNKTVTTMQRTLCTKATTATPTGINNLHLSQVELNLSLAGNLLWILGAGDGTIICPPNLASAQFGPTM